MKDFNAIIKEKLQDETFLREYYREAAYYRLADQLLLLRKKRGLTQKELAEKAGTTQTVVSRLENVSVKPSLESVVKLAEALDAAVEVHLVPFENLHVEPPNKEQTESRLDDEQDTYKLVMNLSQGGENSLENVWKPVTWQQPNNAWVLSERPPLYPVATSKKMPEFA